MTNHTRESCGETSTVMCGLFLLAGLSVLLLLSIGQPGVYAKHSDSNSTGPPPPNPQPGLFTCPDGTQVNTSQGQTCPTQTFTCPDGSQVTNLSDCPSQSLGGSSSGGSSGHHGSSSHESHQPRQNITEVVIQCFANLVSSQSQQSGAIGSQMAINDLNNCFQQAKTGHTHIELAGPINTLR